MIDVLGPEKRRRRTTQEKIAIVQQSFEPGMTVLPCCPATRCGSQPVISLAQAIPGGKSYCCGRRRTGRSCL